MDRNIPNDSFFKEYNTAYVDTENLEHELKTNVESLNKHLIDLVNSK